MILGRLHIFLRVDFFWGVGIDLFKFSDVFRSLQSLTNSF